MNRVQAFLRKELRGIKLFIVSFDLRHELDYIRVSDVFGAQTQDDITLQFQLHLNE